MKYVKSVLRIPLLVLILYLGSVSGYELIRAVQSVGIQSLDWKFYAYAVQGAFEVLVLVWLYRWLGAQSVSPVSSATPEAGS